MSYSDNQQNSLARQSATTDFTRETEDLAQIQAAGGIKIGLAHKVALQLMTKDALGAHSRYELGIYCCELPIGAAVPLILVVFAACSLLGPFVAIGSLIFLVYLPCLAQKQASPRVVVAQIIKLVLTNAEPWIDGGILRTAVN